MDQFLVINIVHIRIRASNMVRFLDVVIKDLAKVRDRQLLRFLFENLEQFDILGGVQQLPGAIKTFELRRDERLRRGWLIAGARA